MIQVLHHRDPDEGCFIDVWVDGVRAETLEIADIDPGRGYTWDHWRERLVEARDDATAHPDDAYRVAVYEVLLDAAASQYITGKPDGWREDMEDDG